MTTTLVIKIMLLLLLTMMMSMYDKLVVINHVYNKCLLKQIQTPTVITTSTRINLTKQIHVDNKTK